MRAATRIAGFLADHEEMLRLIDTRNTDGIEELMRRHLYGGIRRLGGLVFTKYADYFEPMTDETV